MARVLLGLWMAPMLVAQSQPTFYAAYQDGLDAERQERWSAASAAFRRAIELRPASASRVVIYGNNLLKDYAPYTHLAHCLVELGEAEAAQSILGRAAHYGEPAAERETVTQAISQLRQPVPTGKATSSQPATTEPAHVPAAEPHTEPASPVLSAQPPPPAATPGPAVPVLPEAERLQPGRSPLPAQPPVAPKPAGEAGGPPQPESGPRWPLWIVLTLSAVILILRRRRHLPVQSSFKDPEQLGPYRIERLLGRGGFASTYLAHHGVTRTPVALKLLHPYRHDDPEFVTRFRQEARLGTMLNHPNLVRMLDPGPETGPPWLAMEYISGLRLDQRLRENGRPQLAECLRIALQVSGAMAHAHSLGIVHRDLKPGNVIFDGEQAKVMDFGISRIVDSTTLTTTYAFLGTPRYAAPEAQLKAQVGPAADRYAFGIILFEMLAGHPPFDGETPFEILEQHQRAPLPDLALLRPELSASLVALVHGLCQKNPDQRPTDEDVIRILEQVSLEPQPES